MVPSDKDGSGVMFSLDTETGFPDVVMINTAWGLGENVVQGTITPDEYSQSSCIIPLVEPSSGGYRTGAHGVCHK
jgi:phosphoenolpyruvate synthase/pyruvate phosphate dikinase